MPEPFNSNLSIDKYFYNFSKKVSNYIYFIHPNIITILNFSVSYLIFYISYSNLVWNGYFVITLLLLLFRTFLDILDGAHARNTNQSSQVGAFLDCTNDLLFIIVNCFQYFLRIPYHYFFFKIIFFLMSFVLSIRLLILINRNEYDILKDIHYIFKWITTIIHDNTMIMGPFIFIILDYFVYLLK